MNKDLDWTRTFEDLKYQASKSGRKDTEFGTCLKCIKETYGEINQSYMKKQAREYGITIYFVNCDKHAGAIK